MRACVHVLYIVQVVLLSYSKLFQALLGLVKYIMYINVKLWAVVSNEPCHMAIYTPCCISLRKVTLTYPTVTSYSCLCVCDCVVNKEVSWIWKMTIR